MSAARPSTEGKVVLELGRALLVSLEEASPAALEELEQYCNAFADWEKGWKRSLDGRVQLAAKELELGRRIVAQHGRVIQSAEEMKAQVERSLKSLRARGKGLRAYTDNLPKRISTIKRRG